MCTVSAVSLLTVLIHFARAQAQSQNEGKKTPRVNHTDTRPPLPLDRPNIPETPT